MTSLVIVVKVKVENTTMADNMYGYNDYHGPLHEPHEQEKGTENQTKLEEEEEEEDDPLRCGLWMEGDSLAPPCGTTVGTIHKLLEFCRVGDTDVVYDLGCGDGRVCLEALVRFRAAECVGVEIETDLVDRFNHLIDSLPTDVKEHEGKLRIRAIRKDLRQVARDLVDRAKRENNNKIANSHATVNEDDDDNVLPLPSLVVLYLLPEAIAEIEEDLVEMLKVIDPMRILCNTWGLKSIKPTSTLEIEETPGGASTVVSLYTKEALTSH